MVAELIRAFQAGQELTNPAKWKKGQELTNLVGAVVAGGVVVLRHFFPDFFVPDGASEYIAEGVGAILVIVNLYLTRATTKKNLTDVSMENK